MDRLGLYQEVDVRPFRRDASEPDKARQYYGIERRIVAWVTSQERDCDAFIAWHPGFSPQEHRRMLDRRYREQREDRRDAEMRQREDKRDERVEGLQRDLHKKELWVMGGAVTFAVLLGSVAAAILDGAISQGWEPSWWPW